MTYINYDMDRHEQDLCVQFGKDCLYAKALPTMVEEAPKPWIVLLDNDSLTENEYHRWCVMGDLKATWGITDTFAYIEDDPALYGHYIVERDLRETMEKSNVDFAGRVNLESEGGTFFAYAINEGTGREFIDWLIAYINNRERTTA